MGRGAPGEDPRESDIDLRVERAAERGLFAGARMQNELEELLGSPVDLIPESGLKKGLRQQAAADLVPL